MLFLLFGSSGAGKTTVLNRVHGHVERLAVHDFDEIAVPVGADMAWRHRAEELWVRRALDYQVAGTDLLLAGQTPLGELLAVPSAAKLEAISACLLDCDDETRLSRLRARGETWLARTNGGLDDYLAWAAWMRRHAADPTWRRDVITDPATMGEMRWERWADWQPGDRRWCVPVIDTSALSVDEVVGRLIGWIRDERRLVGSGTHPLTAIRPV